MQDFEDFTYFADDMPGVYLLMFDDKVLYVGKSTHVPSRVRIHKTNAIIKFNRVMVRWCALGDLNGLEFRLIQQHRPQHNITHKPEEGSPQFVEYHGEQDICEFYGLKLKPKFSPTE